MQGAENLPRPIRSIFLGCGSETTITYSGISPPQQLSQQTIRRNIQLFNPAARHIEMLLCLHRSPLVRGIDSHELSSVERLPGQQVFPAVQIAQVVGEGAQVLHRFRLDVHLVIRLDTRVVGEKR